MIVVDSNVLAARSLTSEKAKLAQQVELIDSVWIMPTLWRYEFQNILATAIAARQITCDDALHVWREVLALMSDNEREPSAENVIELSARHRITGYDANFIARCGCGTYLFHPNSGAGRNPTIYMDDGYQHPWSCFGCDYRSAQRHPDHDGNISYDIYSD